MAQLAILGHPTRGNEVIEILEMLGGKNENYNGSDAHWVYIIDEEGFIDWNYPLDSYNIFTLEEFLEKFPYKVGDKVCFSDDTHHYLTIMEIWWNDDCSDLECTFFEDNIDVSVSDLHPYKEETMDRKNNDNWAKWELPDGYEFQDTDGNIINTSVIKLVKKQPEYPKTYEVCCMVINNACMTHKGGHKGELIQAFQKLLICRDAYWKIAGDWKPNFGENFIYAIGTCYGTVEKRMVTGCSGILLFPTEEMRDAFYENFKELIEECKEIL